MGRRAHREEEAAVVCHDGMSPLYYCENDLSPFPNFLSPLHITSMSEKNGGCDSKTVKGRLVVELPSALLRDYQDMIQLFL